MRALPFWSANADNQLSRTDDGTSVSMSKCIRIDTNCQSSPAALWRNHLRPITQRVQMIRPPLAHGDARLPVFAAAHRPAARHPSLVMPTRSMASGLNMPLSLRKVEAAARKPCEVMSCCESPMRRKPRASCSRWWVASRCEGPPAPVRSGRCGSGLQAFKDGQRLPWQGHAVVVAHLGPAGRDGPKRIGEVALAPFAQTRSTRPRKQDGHQLQCGNGRGLAFQGIGFGFDRGMFERRCAAT
jgi:hypothetical protein